MARFLIAGEIYRGSSYGHRHPLAIPRVSGCLDLIRALGWLEPGEYIDSPMAAPADLARFHDPAYIAALQQAEASQKVSPEDRARFNLGCNGNPVFPEMFRRPATAVGAGLLAADLISSGQAERVYSPAGGTHHGRAGQASGFCFFNEPVLTILRLLDRGVPRVFYLDLDAHHGDGVADAFAGDPRVLCLSVHEANRWPFTGALTDRAGGSALNLPVPEGFHDAELAYLMEAVVIPAGRAFDAPVLVLQSGSDALADDPLSRLALTNRGYWRAVRRALTLAPQAIVTGGGGYNPYGVARAWAGVWALLTDREIPAEMPPAGQAVLRAIQWDHWLGRTPPDHWVTTLADPVEPAGPVRPEVMALADAARRMIGQAAA